jgi:hypothetical protein
MHTLTHTRKNTQTRPGRTRAKEGAQVVRRATIHSGQPAPPIHKWAPPPPLAAARPPPPLSELAIKPQKPWRR